MKQSLLSSEYRSVIMEAISKELTAAFSYKHVSNHASKLGYFGIAKYFMKESESELFHYQKLVDFMNDMQDVADVPAINITLPAINSAQEAFDIYYKSELELGKWYSEKYNECEDPMVSKILFHFVGVQRKSIGEAGDLLATLERCGNDPSAILLFDESLKK